MDKRIVAALCAVSLLSGCGGDGGGGGTGTFANPSPTPSPTATPTPTGSTCTLAARQQWVLDQMREWYLFPDALQTNVNPTAYSNLEDYLDALTAVARAQRKDRYFTYVTSIQEENAYYSSGASAGFGFRLSYDAVNRRIFVTEAFEGAPALTAGIDRGAEILAIGTSGATMRTVADLYASGGGDAINTAFGPSTPGLTRTLRISDASGTRDVVVTKADYSLTPVSSRYGVKVITENGQRYGYVNLRTFIGTADPALRQAFDTLRTAGVTQVIVDLRYNGGGALSIAQLFGQLLGANRSTSDVFGRLVFRPEKSSENSTYYFGAQSQSIAATRIAFIGTEGTASASELVMNAMVPYLSGNVALIGTNTYGKPVGQIALDQSACDDRLRVIAFSVRNSVNTGDYYDGIASKMPATCTASDDLAYPMGDPREGSTRKALDFLEGKSCAPITLDARAQSVGSGDGRRELLTATRPSPAQRDVPGLF